MQASTGRISLNSLCDPQNSSGPLLCIHNFSFTRVEVDEERKETRLQGLKDRLAVSDDPEAAVLRQEVERLEQEIEDLIVIL